MDDIEAQGQLADRVNRSVADELENQSLAQKRKIKEGRSYVTDEVAEQARESVESWNRDLEGASAGKDTSRAGGVNAPFVRSTPGPDDAPAFSASEKSATGDSENKLVVEEPEELQIEPIKDAPPAHVLSEPPVTEYKNLADEDDSSDEKDKEESSKDEEKKTPAKKTTSSKKS